MPQFVMTLNVFLMVGAVDVPVLCRRSTSAWDPRPQDNHDMPWHMGDVCFERSDRRRQGHVVCLGAPEQMSRSSELRSLAKSTIVRGTILNKQVMEVIP